MRGVKNIVHSGRHSLAIRLSCLQGRHDLRIGRNQINPVREDRVVSDDLPRKLRVPPRRGFGVVHVPSLDFV